MSVSAFKGIPSPTWTSHPARRQSPGVRCHESRGPTQRFGDMSAELRELASPEALQKLEEAREDDLVSSTTFTFDEGWGADILDDDAEEEEPDEDDVDRMLKNAVSDARFDLMPNHMVKRLQSQQQEAHRVNGNTNRDKLREMKALRKTHKRLRIISGEFAGRRLNSPRSKNVRPMMERVRAAVFDMLLSHSGSMGGFPTSTKWLDLFAGTGSVGLEALSRGCGECEFIELDPWVTSSVLEPNIQACSCEMRSSTHTMRAEDYLKRAAEQPQFSRGPFDYISVCPPYLQVSYPELQDLLEQSGLITDESVIFLEYPKQLSKEIRDKIGPLSMVKDRKYGRTFLAVYACT
ncbi:hypothetical protein BSKO_04169 [Bryopsis sp. KO-2023]|nr:hypothetical protein BSKO_04169 [Bryopsis sp. KO-2023]